MKSDLGEVQRGASFFLVLSFQFNQVAARIWPSNFEEQCSRKRARKVLYATHRDGTCGQVQSHAVCLASDANAKRCLARMFPKQQKIPKNRFS